jgi:hypothetical protein
VCHHDEAPIPLVAARAVHAEIHAQTQAIVWPWGDAWHEKVFILFFLDSHLWISI